MTSLSVLTSLAKTALGHIGSTVAVSTTIGTLMGIRLMNQTHENALRAGCPNTTVTCAKAYSYSLLAGTVIGACAPFMAAGIVLVPMENVNLNIEWPTSKSQ